MDASWRIYRGQLPYIDFIYFTGPIHLYVSAVFVSLLGFGKNAILAHLVTVSSVIIILTYLIGKRLASRQAALFSAALTAACFYWPISHPWYDQTAHFWGIIAISTILLTQGTENSARIRQAGFLCGFLCVLSFFTKSNVGAFYLAAFSFIMLGMPARRALVPWYVVGILAGLLINLMIIRSPSLYYEQAFTDYGLKHVKRLSNLPTLKDWLTSGYLGMVLIALGSVIIQKNKCWWQIIFFFAALTVAILSSMSGSMIREANIPLQGVLMALLFMLVSQPVASNWEWAKKVLQTASYLICIFLTIIAVRYGLELKVWTYIGKSPLGQYAIKTGGMRGWMCDQKTGENLDDLVKYINKQIPKHDTLLVLTNLQILYALTGRDSFRHVPFIFTQGEVPALGKQMETVRNHIMAHPPDWVITHTDYTFSNTLLIQYLDLFDFLHERYVPVEKWGIYLMLRKKPDTLSKIELAN